MRPSALCLALAAWLALGMPCLARIAIVMNRNDTYLFEDAQAVFGGDIPPLGLTAQLLVCLVAMVIVSPRSVFI